MKGKVDCLKGVLAGLLLFPISCIGNGIEILMNPVNPYSFGSKDFGNVTLINSGNDQTIQIKCTLKSFDGRPLVEAKYSQLLLKSGVTQFSSLSLSYASVSYFDNAIKMSDQNLRSFPTGNYEYCIEVFEVITNIIEATECIGLKLEILSPPIGIVPETSTELEDIYPYFSWMPPIPLPANLKYQFTLVKVTEGQTPLDAILRNPPLHQTQTSTNFYQYPVSAIRLEKGVKYAWQIKALMNEDPGEKKIGMDYKTESEVCDFTIKPDPKKQEAVFPYAVINTFNEGQVYYSNDTLKIIYKEEYLANVGDYSILNEKLQTIVAKKSALPLVVGENFIQIPITADGIKVGEVYWLEIKNASGKAYKLKFIRL